MLISITRAGATAFPPELARRAVAALPVAGNWLLPLATRAGADDLDLLAFEDTQARWPGRHLRMSNRPTVCLVGDDPGCLEGQGGPDAWRCAEPLARWCAGAIIHASGGEPEHYSEAVRGALLLGRLALIETTSMHAQAWAERLACPTTLLILPSDGMHPIDMRVLH